MFSTLGNTTGAPAFSSGLGGLAVAHNPNKDFEVVQPPDDSIQALKFSPPVVAENFLASGSWDNVVRVWEVKQDGSTVPKAEQRLGGPVLELCWSDDGSKIFAASADCKVYAWDLASNQLATVGQHDQPVKTCNWVQTPSYSCLVSGSWDKTLKFWDMRTANTPAGSLSMPERVYLVDVMYPMAIVCLSSKVIKVFKLEGQPVEVKQIDSPLKFQPRCAAIFKDKNNQAPTGFAIGTIEGRAAIQHIETLDPKVNFTFKCHRSPELNNGYQDIYAVNDIAFHPVHGTLATVGSDGRFSFWDKDARTKLKNSEKCQQPITRCCFNKGGDIFAYSVSYDWSKGHEGYNSQAKNYIFLRACFEEMKSRAKK